MGIGKAQGFSEGWIAGAIISGAYFGDKVSPLSDTTYKVNPFVGTKILDSQYFIQYQVGRNSHVQYSDRIIVIDVYKRQAL